LIGIIWCAPGVPSSIIQGIVTLAGCRHTHDIRGGIGQVNNPQQLDAIILVIKPIGDETEFPRLDAATGNGVILGGLQVISGVTFDTVAARAQDNALTGLFVIAKHRGTSLQVSRQWPHGLRNQFSVTYATLARGNASAGNTKVSPPDLVYILFIMFTRSRNGIG
jgi:hypothetical protein